MKYSKIKKIEKVNNEPVYHITVEKNHNFFANNICVHNCDYRGEVGVILINHDQSMFFEIKNGDRIGQGVLNKVEQVVWTSVNSIEELGATERGQGGFGSTGVK